MDKTASVELMQRGNIANALWKLGLPTMLAMLVSGLYNIVDAFFVSQLGSSQMAAVAVSFPVHLLFIGICMTFGIGGASYVSRLLGAHDMERANQVASTMLYSGIFVSAFLAAVIFVFRAPFLQFLGATASMFSYAMDYLEIYLLTVIFMAFGLIMNQLAGAEGLTKIPMISILLGSVLNIVLNPLLIHQAGLGVRGSAWATFFSILGSDVYLLRFVFRRVGVLTYGFDQFRFQGQAYRETFKIGIPMFISQVLQSAVLALSNIVAAVYGDSAVAACGVINRILSLEFFVIYGFLRGYAPFVGVNFGAQQFDRVRKATRIVLSWTTLYCVAGALLMFSLSTQIMSCFSSDEEMLRVGTWMLQADSLGFIVFGLETVYMNLFAAIGYGKAGGVLNVSLNGFFYLPLLFLAPHFWGLAGLVWAYSAAHLLNMILTFWLKRHYLDRGQFPSFG